MLGDSRAPRLELALGASFLLFTGVFLVEVVHYFETGIWVLVGGRGAFARWPVARALYADVGVHVLGMFVWMGIVVHQLWTRGAGLHPWVGRVGGPLMLAALAYAWRPLITSEIPALHGALGLTMQDLTIAVAGTGIVVELAIGVYKARRGDIEAHRKHLLVSVMFTAAPAVYRLGVLGLQVILDLGDADASGWTSTWVHETAQCFVVLAALATLLTPWLGAHLAVLRRGGQGREYDWVERVAAWGMLSLSAVMFAVYGLWAIDLLVMWGGEQPLMQRADVPAFVLYLIGVG